MKVEKELKATVRKAAIRATDEVTRFAKQRIGEAAEALSLANDLRVSSEIVNEALYKLVDLLYEPASDGGFANADAVDGRILIPTPWGSDGWKAWKLRNWEAVVLRKILLARMPVAKPLALFGYSQRTNRWHVDLDNYETKASAFEYLKQNPITVQEWRKYGDSYRVKRERQRKMRQNT